jgi:hypothetical protein
MSAVGGDIHGTRSQLSTSIGTVDRSKCRMCVSLIFNGGIENSGSIGPIKEPLRRLNLEMGPAVSFGDARITNIHLGQIQL